MTIDERLEKLTERHEALTQTVELITAEGLAFRREFRRAVRLGIQEARNQRKRSAVLDEKIAAAQLSNQELFELLKRFLERGGNGGPK
jgi:archaellum component FlaC